MYVCIYECSKYVLGIASENFRVVLLHEFRGHVLREAKDRVGAIVPWYTTCITLILLYSEQRER